jgi:hypothetical protein
MPSLSTDLRVTWEQIVGLSRQLEAAALQNNVRPESGARLVRLILQFHRQLVGDPKLRPSTR